MSVTSLVPKVKKFTEVLNYKSESETSVTIRKVVNKQVTDYIHISKDKTKRRVYHIKIDMQNKGDQIEIQTFMRTELNKIYGYADWAFQASESGRGMLYEVWGKFDYSGKAMQQPHIQDEKIETVLKTAIKKADSMI
jgi:hypothetical protein